MNIDEPKELQELRKQLRLPMDALNFIFQKKDSIECLVNIHGKDDPKVEKDEPYASVHATYNAKEKCFDYDWKSLDIDWQKLVKVYEGQLQQTICKGHELYTMYDITLRHCKPYILVISDLEGNNLGACSYEFINGAWSCRVGYSSQSNNNTARDRGTRPATNRSQRQNRMRSEQPYISSPSTNTLSEQEAVLKSIEGITQHVLAVTMEENKRKLDHEKEIQVRELRHSDKLHRRNSYYKGGLSMLFVIALTISFFTNNVDTTAPMVAVLLGAIFAPAKSI